MGVRVSVGAVCVLCLWGGVFVMYLCCAVLWCVWAVLCCAVMWGKYRACVLGVWRSSVEMGMACSIDDVGCAVLYCTCAVMCLCCTCSLLCCAVLFLSLVVW